MQIPGRRSWAGCQHNHQLNTISLEDRNRQKFSPKRLSWEYFSPQVLPLWHVAPVCEGVTHEGNSRIFTSGFGSADVKRAL